MVKLKDIMYASLGLGAELSQNSKHMYDAYIEKGKDVDPIVAGYIEDVFENFDNLQDDAKEKIAELFATISDKLGYVKLEEYEKLQKRIVNLEAEIRDYMYAPKKKK